MHALLVTKDCGFGPPPLFVIGLAVSHGYPLLNVIILPAFEEQIAKFQQQRKELKPVETAHEDDGDRVAFGRTGAMDRDIYSGTSDRSGYGHAISQTGTRGRERKILKEKKR